MTEKGDPVYYCLSSERTENIPGKTRHRVRAGYRLKRVTDRSWRSAVTDCRGCMSCNPRDRSHGRLSSASSGDSGIRRTRKRACRRQKGKNVSAPIGCMTGAADIGSACLAMPGLDIGCVVFCWLRLFDAEKGDEWTRSVSNGSIIA